MYIYIFINEKHIYIYTHVHIMYVDMKWFLSPVGFQLQARHRRIKEKYGQSEFKKMLNRTKFGVDPEDNIYSEAWNSGRGPI